MKLIFQNKSKKENIIAEPQSVNECLREIQRFLAEFNYESHSLIVWEVDNRLVVEFGSWVEFLYIEGISFKEYRDSVKDKTIDRKKFKKLHEMLV